MKKVDLKEALLWDKNALILKINEFKGDLFTFKMKHAVVSSKQTHVKKMIKKNIARLSTLLSQKQ